MDQRIVLFRIDRIGLPPVVSRRLETGDVEAGFIPGIIMLVLVFERLCHSLPRDACA